MSPPEAARRASHVYPRRFAMPWRLMPPPFILRAYANIQQIGSHILREAAYAGLLFII